MTASVVRSTTTSRVFGIVCAIAVVALALLPTWGSDSFQRKLIELFVLIALAQMWNLLAGFAGVVSVGQQAFVGLGAYGMIIWVNNNGLNLYLSIVLSAVFAAAISIPMGLIAFRLRGSYFAIGTWVLAEVASLMMKSNNSVGGGSGASIKVAGTEPAARLDMTYWFAFTIGVGSIALSYIVLRSRLGLQLQATRDNEGGARSLGVHSYRAQFGIWVIAAFVTAAAGATFYLLSLRVQPTGAFSVAQWTAPIIFIVVIGGIGTIEGPIIGALIYYWGRDQFLDQLTWYQISLGLVAIVAALWGQRGLWGVIRGRFGVELFPVRRRLVITASDAD